MMFKLLLAAVAIAGNAVAASGCNPACSGDQSTCMICAKGNSAPYGLYLLPIDYYAGTGSGVYCNKPSVLNGDVVTKNCLAARTDATTDECYHTCLHMDDEKCLLMTQGNTNLPNYLSSAKPNWSTVSNECLAVATDDTTCAAISAAKPKFVGNDLCRTFKDQEDDYDVNEGVTDKQSCTAKCVDMSDATSGRIRCVHSAWDSDNNECILRTTVMLAKCANYVDNVNQKGQCLAAASCCVACVSTADCTGTDVCSTATPNTCVAVGSSDATCAAIDAAKPKFGAGNGGLCVACLSNSATPNTCVAVGSSDATCAAIDAAKPKFLAGNGGSCVMCLITTDCTTTDVCSTTTPNTCVPVGSSDATCVAINFAMPKFVGSACVAASPPVTCGDGTALTANKCEIISPTEVELAKMCGDGTTYDKAKKKCVTDPTSRCTTNAESAKESAGSRTATLTVITATMLVLVVIPLY